MVAKIRQISGALVGDSSQALDFVSVPYEKLEIGKGKCSKKAISVTASPPNELEFFTQALQMK